ncbi:aminotransferase class I/II-fold pyridoxal phosphate-dependent enzyme [Patescibacteria group bacterium AH-259-L07]|nr:aminotransferase class I/II-fold pyridoxal phosphate-dependent enzyme [Patescibacteria group bacterium AH-259-L07]
MSKINKQADELNKIIKQDNPAIYNLLSENGKAIFFPKKGILSQTREAKGKKINATIGIAVEDDGSPVRLTSIAKNISLDPKDIFPYAPSYGKPELRKVWQNMIKKKNPSLKARISLPVVTTGLTQGLSISGYLFINPGDKIILPDKFWPNYKLIFENAYNGILDTFNTFKNGGFDVGSFEKKLKKQKGKKIILLNFPNNPTGYTLTNKEAKELAKIIKENSEIGNEIIVICDDAYFGLVYKKGIYKQSVFSLFADLDKNVLAIKIDGATKEDYTWGLRVGFITYASKGISKGCFSVLESKTGGIIRGNISSSSHLSQSLVLKAITSLRYENEKTKKYNFLKSRFNKVEQVLKNNKYSKFFSVLPYNSGYFMCIELRKGLDPEKIRQVLLNKYDTGVIAGENFLRIAFSSVSEKHISKLFENIYNACEFYEKH